MNVNIIHINFYLHTMVEITFCSFSRTTSEGHYTFQPLKPGQLYTIAISTIHAGNPSETVVQRAITSEY